jgi:RNA polymerase sigma-70 factor, ECF subfamily
MTAGAPATPTEGSSAPTSSPRATGELTPAASKDVDLHAAIGANAPGWQRLAYDEFFPLVRGLIVRALGPKLDNEDLVADVFVAFFENARNIRSAEGVRSYVVSIAMNLIRRELRQRRRRNLLGFSDDERKLSERIPSNDDPRAKAALHQLSQILKTLNTEDHLAFVLCALEGMKLEEAAASLGISVSSVKRRLRAATETLEKRVQQNPLLADYLHDKGAMSRRVRSSDKGGLGK